MTASDVTMQFLADILASPVDRPVVMETTALGAAYLAGRAAGLCPDLDGFAAQWRLDRRFEPRMDAADARAQICRLAGRGAPHVNGPVRLARRELPGRRSAPCRSTPSKPKS